MSFVSFKYFNIASYLGLFCGISSERQQIVGLMKSYHVTRPLNEFNRRTYLSFNSIEQLPRNAAFMKLVEVRSTALVERVEALG